MTNTKNEDKQQKTVQAKPIIGITCGDPNGVGYEIILKALCDFHIAEICTPIVYGNLQAAKKHLSLLDEEIQDISFNLIDNVDKAQQGKLNIINCYPDHVPLNIGHSTPEAGRASLAALNRCTTDLKRGVINAIVTAPINKENIQSEHFRFSGHTEYLTSMFGNGRHSLMMMVSDMMKVAIVCNHIPLNEVSNYITEENILNKLTLLNDTLKNDFWVRKPRIAVLALNPHAGDNGLLGSQEQEIIKPALEKAKEQGIWAFGPYSADGFFGAGKFSHFDAVLGMYHDQGLIPFKSLDMAGVNFTAGLDIVRTSPDHGTAYEIAGKNQADSASLRNAIYLAIHVLKTRQENLEINKDPLVVNIPESPRKLMFQE